MDSIDKYIFVGDYNKVQLQKAHDMVIEFRENMFSGKDRYLIQDLFLNRGCTIDDDKRPTSYFELSDHIIPRTNIKAGLRYLQYMIQLATKPELAIVHKPRIYTDGISGLIIPADIKDNTTVTTSSGMDFGKIEYLQTEWLRRNDIVPDVRELEKHLQSSFNEFNLKWILSAIYNSERLFIPNDWKDISNVSNKLKKVPWRDVFTHLDNAYYNTARRYMGNAASVAENLMKDDYGSLFVIAQEDMREFIRISQSKMYYD